MARRIVRVFPLYYLSLFILFFLIPESFFDLSYYKQHAAWYWLYGTNWLISLEGWSPTKTLDHFWSLAIEEQFYILWPLFVWMFSQKGLLRFSVFLFFGSLIFRNVGLSLGFVMPFPYVATLARMEPIALGAILSILTRTHKSVLEKFVPYLALVTFIAAVVLFAIAGTFHMEYYIHYTINYTVVDLFFVSVIAITISQNLPSFFKKLFTHPLIMKIGVMSYCLYIFHNLIHSVIKHKYLATYQAFSGSVLGGYILMMIIGIAVTIPVCYVIHRYIEMPLWKLKRYF
jgi:peptidoglycan/LPS O-acetylase OafA/YrhL